VSSDSLSIISKIDVDLWMMTVVAMMMMTVVDMIIISKEII